jgi:hypothetical protein
MTANVEFENLAVVSCQDPDAYGTGTTNGDAIDMAFHREVAFYVMAGDMASTATVDFRVEESATSGGTYTAISGKSITQLTEASTDDNKQAVVIVNSAELGSGKRYIHGRLVIAAASCDAGVLALAARPRYTTAAGTTVFGDLASVDEIVN